jgi:hypothetical protein
MTKSAKQDAPEGQAEQAETESAATTNGGEPKAVDTKAVDTKAVDTKAVDIKTVDTKPEATNPAADAGDNDADNDGAKPDIDDVKRKFREALDRKSQGHSEGQGKGSHDGGKVSGAHGPAASRRSFRRKSG